MSKMKYSGVEWIGNIPNEWYIKPLKSICDGFNNGCSNEQLQYGNSNYPVSRIETISTGVIDFDKVGYVEKIKDTYKLNKNDFLISNINSISYLGNCAIYGGKQVLYHGMNLLRVIPNKIYSNYLFYYFKSVIFRKYMQIYCKPAINQASVSATNLKSMKVPFPNKKEQILIANFLDKKSDELNQILNDLNKQIEILEKYKISLITEKVTKGMNKKQKFKKSNLKWIKKIPESWSTNIRIKDLFTFSNGLSITKADLKDLGEPVISYGQIHSKLNKSTYINNDLIRYVDWLYIKYIRISGVKKGDFIFADTSEDLQGCGNFIYVDENRQLFAGYHTIILKAKENMNNKYLSYLFLTDIWRSQIRSKVYGVKVFSITQKILKEAKVILPSLDEQKEIVKYLDKKCNQIDKIVEDKQKQIQNIEEYKKSVIYEYVTGKKRVEGAEELYG